MSNIGLTAIRSSPQKTNASPRKADILPMPQTVCEKLPSYQEWKYASVDIGEYGLVAAFIEQPGKAIRIRTSGRNMA